MSPAFRLEDYEPVEDRLAKFWIDHPFGRVATELVAYSDAEYIVRAAIFRHEEDAEAAATGYAQEKVGASPVNRVSALENCETSAIGRALANAGYATKGKRPSREEMAKANRPRRDWLADVGKLSNPDKLRDLWRDCSFAGELTDEIKAAITAQVQAIEDADQERQCIEAEAQAELVDAE